MPILMSVPVAVLGDELGCGDVSREIDLLSSSGEASGTLPDVARTSILFQCRDATAALAVIALTTGVALAAGLVDGAGQGRELTIELVRRLEGRLGVPLSVDLEKGYDEDPSSVAELVALAARGVVGVNLEDGGRSTGAHEAIVAAVRRGNGSVFLNARVDEFWSGRHDLVSTLERCRAYRDAGAHGLFVPGLQDPYGVEAVARIGLPVNVLWQPGLDLRKTPAAPVNTGSASYRAALAAALATADAALATVDASRSSTPPPPAVTYPATQAVLFHSP